MILANLEYGLSHTAPTSMQAMSAAGSQQPAATSQLQSWPDKMLHIMYFIQFDLYAFF